MEKLIGLIIIAIIGFAFRSIRNSYLESRTPPDETTEEYIKELKKIKRKGGTYHEQLSFLMEKGLPKKVAENIVLRTEEE